MITGTQNPVVGKDEIFQFSDGLDLFNSSNATYVWNIWKKKAGTWINITQKPPKMGKKVSFKFGEKVLGEEFKLQVFKATPKLFSEEFETKSVGEFFLVPTSSKVPKIDKVILLNQGAKDPNKASYRDTLTARAYCVAMFNNEVEFQLWEDDAAGPGHNASINKNNQLPQTFKGRVNENGTAEVKISLLSNASILKAIANKYMMSGDKDEGANHEYYVTASYAGKIQKASQVNVDVANPDHQAKPKDDSAKFPATNDSKTKSQPDPKGNIKDAYFVNDKNQKLSSVLVNSHVKVQILSSNLIGKYIQYVVWEKDFGIHDEIFRSGKIKVPGDICNTGGFKITESHFQKGIDLAAGDPDSDKQNYFLEIIVLDSTAESKKFGLDDTAPQQMEVVRSAAQVKSTANKKTNSTCICKEQYKDLIWGEMVSCDFRKKVVQISAELWGESRKMEMADGLMAVMNVETAGSFKAHQIMGKDLKDVKKITKDDFWLTKSDGTKTSRAVGLIQFTQSALQAIGEFTAGTGFDKLHAVKLKFATMGEIKQLDYVKKYFMDARSKIKTPADIYLHVFAPSGVAKKDDYVLYVEGTEEYRQNKSVDLGSKGQYKEDGKIQRSEILERFDDSMKKGANNKSKKYSCKNIPENKSINKSESGFYIYRNGDIKFIASENSIKYFVQVKKDSSDFKEIGTLTKNSFGMVKFPDSGNGFGRYGGVDTGGNSKIENVGKGDHYLLPETAAALFGVTTEVKEKNWEIHFGDMSSENGSDPTSSPEKASSHHAGHGHKGTQSGLNADFRYLNKTGKSFQGLSSSGSFDDSKNKELFNIAFKFGFNKNYATGKTYSGVNSKVGGHYDHGHFGTLSIKYETVEKLNVKIIQ